MKRFKRGSLSLLFAAALAMTVATPGYADDAKRDGSGPACADVHDLLLGYVWQSGVVELQVELEDAPCPDLATYAPTLTEGGQPVGPPSTVATSGKVLTYTWDVGFTTEQLCSRVTVAINSHVTDHAPDPGNTPPCVDITDPDGPPRSGVRYS